MKNHNELYRRMRREADLHDADAVASFYCSNCKRFLDRGAETAWVRNTWNADVEEVIEDSFCDDCIAVDETRRDASSPPSE